MSTNTASQELSYTDSKQGLEYKEETPYYEKFSNFQRYFLLILMTFNGLVGPISSNMVAPAMIPIKLSFGYSEKQYKAYFNLLLTVYLFSLAIGPLFWGVLADSFGRRTILASLFFYSIGSLLCGFSTSPEMLIFFRFVQGFGSSATTLIGIGVITDVFNREMRGRAIGVFQIGLNFGPVIGPMIGGNLLKLGKGPTDWTPIFWFCSVLGAVLFFINFFFLTETLNPSKRINPPVYRDSNTKSWKFNTNYPNPFAGFVYFKYPIIVIPALWTMIAFGSYYVIVAFQPYIFTGLKYSPVSIGYTFVAVGLGNVAGCILGGVLSDFSLKRAQRKAGSTKVEPEVRLYGSILPAVLIIVALLCTGYLSDNPYTVPGLLTCQFLVGLSVLTTISIVTTYIIDMLAEKSGKAAGFVVFWRLFFAGITSYIAEPIKDLVGNHFKTFAVFAGLQFLGFIILFVCIKYGKQLRAYNNL